jgi:hypothetical protein
MLEGYEHCWFAHAMLVTLKLLDSIAVPHFCCTQACATAWHCVSSAGEVLV